MEKNKTLYELYCEYYEMSPNKMYKYDKERFEGAPLAGYIYWRSMKEEQYKSMRRVNNIYDMDDFVKFIMDTFSERKTLT